jgi:hypothetical protein
MNTGPITTETLLQLLTAARLTPEKRELVRAEHRDGEPVDVRREADFTFTMLFRGGGTVRLSYQEGNELLSTVKR